MNWISVKEALPDDDIEVLAYRSTGHFELAHVDSNSGAWRNDGGVVVRGVTYWMHPIPPDTCHLPPATR